MTFDHEHVPTDHLRALQEAGVNVQPGPDALVHAQDKLVMRAAIDRLELPNPEWASVDDVDALVRLRRRHRLARGPEDARAAATTARASGSSGPRTKPPEPPTGSPP